MIYDAIENFNDYSSLHPLFPSVLRFIKDNSLSDLEIGKINIAKGVHAIVSEYETNVFENKFIECHKKYIDIQLLVDGIEQIGICNKNECEISDEYNEEKDLEKLSGEIDLITLRNGYFAIFYPQDGHVPGLKYRNQETRVKKIVFKVSVK